MGQFSNSAGIMYPAEFSNHYAAPVELPGDLHTTVMYLGEIDQLNYMDYDVLEALTEVDLNMFIWTEVIGKELFGPDQDIPVLRVDNSQLQRNFDKVEAALSAVGIKNGSSFPDYKPHITVPIEVWNAPPKHALLMPAQLWWGETTVSLDGSN